jgi:hypothetical protein
MVEDALPITAEDLVEDEEMDEIERKIRKKESNFLCHTCRQSRNLWLEFKFSELAKLFGEETCRAAFRMKGHEKVTVFGSGPTKVSPAYPMQSIMLIV